MGQKNLAAPMRGVAVAPVGLGFFSLLVYWWFPFPLILAGAGLVIGLVSLAMGNKGGPRGENYAAIGTGLCALSITIVLTLNYGIHWVLGTR
jgi:hypothetical protein